MFSIGEFSKMTGMTVKTLRFYHEQGILAPSHIEAGNGYRFYEESKVEVARAIAILRELDFSLAEIKDILSQQNDEAAIVEYLKSRRDEIQQRMRSDRQIAKKLDRMILFQQHGTQNMKPEPFEVEENHLAPVLVASFPMTGRYSDCGIGFSKIGRQFGRYICGKPMVLYHDGEFRADDANFEPAMPIQQGKPTKEIMVQTLPGGRCLSLMHVGPYENLPRSYEKLIKHAKSHGMEYLLPTREVYHKGPGMIFRGNPQKYLTEIQFLLDE